MIKQSKQNTGEEKKIIQDYFMDCRFRFQDQYKGKVKLIEKNFPLYAVDKTQVPCLLTMDLITYSEGTMTKEDFKSYKIYVQDVLNGYRPPIKFQVIEGGKK
tara:strand:+ start:285 stop:590 length:306 start_codon:yes stop_codon:yes gene_type:complete